MAKSRTVDKVDMLAVPEFVSGYKSSTPPADRWRCVKHFGVCTHVGSIWDSYI
ncbi:MAG: hypothetical protein R2788_12955 [Saprospiraceae bacterium]